MGDQHYDRMDLYEDRRWRDFSKIENRRGWRTMEGDWLKVTWYKGMFRSYEVGSGKRR